MFLKLEWKSVLAATYFWVWNSYTGMHLCFCFSLRTNLITQISVRKTLYVLFLYYIFFIIKLNFCMCFQLCTFRYNWFFSFCFSSNYLTTRVSANALTKYFSGVFFSDVCPRGSLVENNYMLGLWYLTLIITCAFVVVIRPVLIQ
jgi:hypothetical protein